MRRVPGIQDQDRQPTVAGDEARLGAVRAALGPDYEIMTDANQSMTGPEAARRLPLMEALNIGWFEEPLPPTTSPATPALPGNPVCRSPWARKPLFPGQFADYIAAGACGIVQADVARVGGITPG